MEIVYVKNGCFPVLDEDICCAIGNFDGLHLGHQKLIEQTFSSNKKTAVLTFNPHPSSVLMQIKNYKQLTPISHKIKLFESYNLDYLFLVDFNLDIANMSIDDFISNLKKLGIKEIVCGYDFSFGKKALGTPKDLENDFNVNVVEKFQINNIRVSSTYIKELLREGEVEKIPSILGRSYSIIGKVVKGKQIGRTIGFRTANLALDNYFIPLGGVYASRVKIGDKIYIGMTNVGFNPTICYSTDVKVEVHIFDFDDDIYEEEIEVYFDKHIRPEQKFSNLDHLKNQLTKDKQTIYRFYREANYETFSRNC